MDTEGKQLTGLSLSQAREYCLGGLLFFSPDSAVFDLASQ